jgi:hypothetical protein
MDALLALIALCSVVAGRLYLGIMATRFIDELPKDVRAQFHRHNRLICE